MSRATWQSLYLAVSGAVFLIVAVFHLLRLLNHWPVVVGSLTIPLWPSGVGLAVSSGYCVWAAWLFATARRPVGNAGTPGHRDRTKL